MDNGGVAIDKTILTGVVLHHLAPSEVVRSGILFTVSVPLLTLTCSGNESNITDRQHS